LAQLDARSVMPASPVIHRAVDPKVDLLAAMFPDVEKDTLELVLSFHHGDVERAVVSLLDNISESTDAPAESPSGVAARQEHLDLDAQVARQEQLDIDAQVAAMVHKQIQEELQAERKSAELGPRALAAARKWLTARAATRPKRETHTRLLSSDNADVVMPPSPLVPEYSPPLAVPPMPPSGTHAAASPLYDSRIQRARQANSVRQSTVTRESMLGAGQTAPMATLSIPESYATEGELI